MKHLIIRFINSDDLIGHAIDWVTFSLWDHVEFGTPQGTWIGAHVQDGVQERTPDYLTPSRERRYAVPVTDYQYDSVMSKARSLIGTKYNLLDIGGLFLHDAELNHPHQVICSQFVFDGLLAGGLRWLNVLPDYSNRLTPETLHLMPALIGCAIPSDAVRKDA